MLDVEYHGELLRDIEINILLERNYCHLAQSCWKTRIKARHIVEVISDPIILLL